VRKSHVSKDQFVTIKQGSPELGGGTWINRDVLMEYDNYPIIFDVSNTENIMANATEIGKIYGKKPNDWLRLPSTISFLKILSNTRKSGISDNQLVTIKQGAPENGKKPNNWLRLPSTTSFLKVLETTRKSRSLIKTVEGQNGGT